MILNRAKLRLVITICHEFVHHKIHKYLLNDKWSKAKDEKTLLDLVESGFYWEKYVIVGRVIKINKTTYSFITYNDKKINLEDDFVSVNRGLSITANFLIFFYLSFLLIFYMANICSLWTFQ